MRVLRLNANTILQAAAAAAGDDGEDGGGCGNVVPPMPGAAGMAFRM